MASLRSLMGTVTPESISSTRGVDSTTKLSSQPFTGYRVEYISSQCGGNCQGALTTNFDYYAHSYWTVPTGATEVIFEIWGAGGGGGRSCCCSRGIPGNSGAYAYKKLSGNLVVPGCKYNAIIGQGGDGGLSSQCGGKGGTTSITGYGLTNFCAEGGNGGCSQCFACCCFVLTSNSVCAVFCGADFGARGNVGYAYIACYDNHCWNKQFVPYPGGLVNGKGGWLGTNMNSDTTCGYGQMQFGMSQLGWSPAGTENQRAYAPGIGGVSAYTCGGGCCCGTWGSAGLIRISYK